MFSLLFIGYCPHFFKRFPPQFLILIGLQRMTSFCQRINTLLSLVEVEGRETSPIYSIVLIFLTGLHDLHVQ